MIGNDSRTGAGPVSFTPTVAGDLAWSVTASNGAGSATAKGQLHIVDARPPTAQFTAAAKVPVNTATTFTDQSTGLVTSWAWTVNGQPVSDKQSPDLVFPSVGTYSVRLTVSNSFGPSSVTKDIVVTTTPQITVPSIPVDSSGGTKRIEVRKGVAINFQAGPTNVGVTGWEWAFGDGRSSTEQSPSKTYDTAGEYRVVLTAKFTGSLPSDSDELIVKVT
jgi:PKD repeat protein